jgi:hypothetical protein
MRRNAMRNLIAILVLSAGAALAQPSENCRPKPLRPNDNRQGQVDPACRLRGSVPGDPNGNDPADLYELQLHGTGNLVVRAASRDVQSSIDTLIRLYDAHSRRKLKENDTADDPKEAGPGGVDAAVHIHLGPGSYLVAVSALRTSRPYTLIASFDGPAVCPESKLELNQATPVTFSDADCRMWDMPLGENSNESYARWFGVTLPRSGSLTVEGGRLYGRDNRRLVSDGPLEPGDYRILAVAPAHSITAQFSPSDCPIQDLKLGSRITQAFGPGDCRVGDVQKNSNRAYLKRYKFETRAKGILVVDRSRNDVDFNPHSLEPGAHVLSLTTPSAGPFSFIARFCSVEPMELGTESSVELDPATACRGADVGLTPATALVRRYELALKQRGTLAVEATGGATVLVDGAVRPDRSTQQAVQPGTHAVAVMSLSAAQTRRYTVAARFACQENKASLGVDASGTFAPGDCTISESGRTLLAHYFSLQMVRRGRLQVDLTTSGNQTSNAQVAVRIQDDRGREFASPGTRPLASLEPGPYKIVVTTTAESGSYTIRPTLGPACETPDLTLGDTRSASFNTDDCRLRDFTGGVSDQAFVQGYHVRLPARGRFAAFLESRVFPPEILLYSGRERTVSASAAVGQRAVLQQDLDAGEYFLYVKADRATGDYQLRAAAHPAQGEVLPLDRRSNAELWPTEPGVPFRINLASRTALDLEIQSTDFAPQLRLFNLAGGSERLLSQTLGKRGIAAHLTPPALEPGSYVVRVDSPAGAGGQFTLLAGHQDCRVAVWTGSLPAGGRLRIGLPGGPNMGALAGDLPARLPPGVRAYRAEHHGQLYAVKSATPTLNRAPETVGCFQEGTLQFYTPRLTAPRLTVVESPSLSNNGTLVLSNNGPMLNAIVLEWN